MKPIYLLTLASLCVPAVSNAQGYAPQNTGPQNKPQAADGGNGQSTTAKGQKPEPKPSGKARKAMIALANAVNAKDAAAFAAALPEAKAVASTSDDQYLIGMLEMNMAIAAKDNAAVETAVEQIAQSGYLSKPEMVGLYKGLGGTFGTAKQYDQAVAAYEKGLSLDPSNVDLLSSLAETRFASNKAAEGITALRRAIAAQTANGGKAPENYYKRGVSVAYDAKLPVAADLARDWVAAYPTVDSWHNALAIYQNTAPRSPALSFEIYRLMAATNSLGSSDYVVYSSIAFDAGNYVEAQKAIDAGIAAGKIKADTAGVKDVLDGLKAKPKATAADLAEAAKTVKDAAGRMRVGDRYMGMGNYSDAIALYRAAEGQPGVDQDLLKLHLGAALARSGDKAGAKAVLGSVGGAWKTIASYWLVFVA